MIHIQFDNGNKTTEYKLLKLNNYNSKDNENDNSKENIENKKGIKNVQCKLSNY